MQKSTDICITTLRKSMWFASGDWVIAPDKQALSGRVIPCCEHALYIEVAS